MINPQLFDKNFILLSEEIKALMLDVDGTIVSGRWRKQKELKHKIEQLNIIGFETFQEKCWALINQITERPKCSQCENITPLLNIKKGFQKTCSIKCSRQGDHKIKMQKIYGHSGSPFSSKEIRNKIKQTNLERYGTENVFSSNEIKNKIKQTNLERYGVEHPMHSNEIKQLFINTNQKRYNVDNPMQNVEIYQKSVKTNLERYGTENVFSSNEIKNKIKQTNLERYGAENVSNNLDIRIKVEQTNLERYGSKCSLQNKDVKIKAINTIKKLYGVEHIMQNKEIKNKVVKSNQECYIKKWLVPKLNQLSFQNIFPVNWNIENYIGIIEDGYTFIHTECGTIFQNNPGGNRVVCPKCRYGRGSLEIELSSWLETIIEITPSSRKIISPYELDIFIPTHQLAIEINGIYWHQADNKTSLLKKTEMCNNLGIELLHFWDYELSDKMDIIKSMILSRLNLSPNKIFARRCNIEEISSQEAQIFFNENHLNGFVKGAQYIALKYNNKIVQAMSIGKPRFSKQYDIELLRSATICNTNVIGGFSKLLNYLKLKYKNKTLISYADRRYSIGNSYEKTGFNFSHYSSENYFWCKNKIILPRYKCQKHKLPHLLGDKFNKKLSEKLNMENNGFYQIKDCGNLVYFLQL